MWISSKHILLLILLMLLHLLLLLLMPDKSANSIHLQPPLSTR